LYGTSCIVICEHAAHFYDFSVTSCEAPWPTDRDTATNGRRIAVALKGGFPMVDGGRGIGPSCAAAARSHLPRRAGKCRAGPGRVSHYPFVAITLHYTLYFLLQFADTR